MSTALKIKNASVDNNNKSIKDNNTIKDNNKKDNNDYDNKINNKKDKNNKKEKDNDKNKNKKDKKDKKDAKPKSEKGVGMVDGATSNDDGPPVDKYGNPFPIENPEGGDPICTGGYKIDYQFDPLNDPINPPFNCIPILKGPGSLAGKLLAMANNPSAGVKILADGEVPSFGGKRTRKRRRHRRSRNNKHRSSRRSSRRSRQHSTT